MRILLAFLASVFLVPAVYAQDEGDMEPVEEPAIEMVAGAFECYEYQDTLNIDARITVSTFGSDGACDIDTDDGRRSCSSMKTGILALLANEDYDCSDTITTGKYIAAIRIEGTFVCRGSRNAMVNLTADFCEWAYQH